MNKDQEMKQLLFAFIILASISSFANQSDFSEKRCETIYDDYLVFFYGNKGRYALLDELIKRVKENFPSELNSNTDLECKNFILKTGLELLNQKYFYQDIVTEKKQIISKYKDFNVFLEQNYNYEIDQLSKMFPEYQGDGISLLAKYEELVLQIRTNISPRLTDFLAVTFPSEMNRINPINLQYLHGGTKEFDEILNSSEAFLKMALYDEFTKEIFEEVINYNQVHNIIDLSSIRNAISNYTQEYTDFKETTRHPKVASNSFIELARKFRQQGGYSFSHGSGFGFNYNSTSLAGSGGSNSTGNIVKVDDRLMLCFSNDCTDAQHLFGDLYWAKSKKSYLVIEKKSLKHAQFSNKILDRVFLEKSCFRPKAYSAPNSNEKLTNLEKAEIAGKTVFWGISTLGLAIGDTVVSGVKSVKNKKLDFDYDTTKQVYKNSQKSLSNTYDKPIDRKMENSKTKYEYDLKVIASKMDSRKTLGIIEQSEKRKILEKLVEAALPRKEFSKNSCEGSSLNNRLDVGSEISGNLFN